MLPDVRNGQACCLYVRYAEKCFNLLGEFADIFLLIAQLKLHRIRDVCTFYVGHLV